jgi:flagellar biosynthetic protein FliQ
MSPATVMDLAYQGMKVTLLMAAPLLATALLVGLVVSLFQAATQINEMTLSFIPKIVAVLVVLIIAGPWLLGVIQHFTRHLFLSIPVLIGS